MSGHGGEGPVDARPVVRFTFAGRERQARVGDTVAMALWRAGEVTLRVSSRDGAPRGAFCHMGVCYECLCRVDGRLVRGCTTVVQDGMQVERGGPT